MCQKCAILSLGGYVFEHDADGQIVCVGRSMHAMEPRSVLVVIVGRVQGVGFRAHVDPVARRLGLDGFVRNRLDGTVEAAFRGPPDKVETMLEACRTGPAGSRVDDVELIAEGLGVPTGFEIRPTA